MPQVVVKGESVYKCNVCSRSIRVPTNKEGIDVLQRCIITSGCLGKLRRVTIAKDINETPAFPPEVQGVQDWFQRRVLYTHQQPVQSFTWLVTHNLVNRPKIHVFVDRSVDGVAKQIPINPVREITVDANNTILEFASAESGLAQCIALASQNTTNPLALVASAEPTDAFQISSNTGEVTLATLSSSSLVGLALTYRTSGTAIDLTIEYAGIDVGPSSESPWSGSQRAVINGRQYTLRSFNIERTPLAPAYFAAGAVPEGSSFFISNFNGAPLQLGECLILLGRNPYATVDRITDRYIDASTINTVTPELYYSLGAGFAVRSVIKPTYPQILVV